MESPHTLLAAPRRQADLEVDGAKEDVECIVAASDSQLRLGQCSVAEKILERLLRCGAR